MSGGHWGYIQFRIEDIARELNPEIHLEERELGELLMDISKVINDCEYWKSGDYSFEQFKETWDKLKEKFNLNGKFAISGVNDE